MPYSLLVIVSLVALIIFCSLRLKWHPVFSLLTAALLGGLALGLNPEELSKTIAAGFGSTLGSIGLVIALGTVIGHYLEQTGGTRYIADKLLQWTGPARAPWALNIAGFVISIPVFCDSGFIVLSPLTKSLAQRSNWSRLVLSIALATGLYAAHVFVPPTPGPLAAAALLDANLGLLLGWGLLVGLIAATTGYLWARFGLSSQKAKEDPQEMKNEELIQSSRPTGGAGHFLPVLIPVLLIGLGSVANWPGSALESAGMFTLVLQFLGSPVIALGVGLLFSFLLAKRFAVKEQQSWILKAFEQAGVILLVTGTGGAFGAVLKTVDLASMLPLSGDSAWGALLVFFALSALLKSAQGSSTVAILTVSSIAAPLLGEVGLANPLGRVCAVLAIGAGAMTVSHVNDSYFWVVNQFTGLTVKQSLRSLTLATGLQGVVSIASVIALYLVLGSTLES